LAWVARQWRTLIDQRLRSIGQNAARMEALATIAHSHPESTQIEIANRIGRERATITRMFASLEEDGLVVRLSDPADRRTKWIRLTDAGHAALAEIQVIVREMRFRLLDGIDPDAVERTNAFLSELLVRLDKGLPAPEAPGDAAPGE
jgi:MarR family transcriptional regulator for hemolysin